jgi:hypothetical protein
MAKVAPYHTNSHESGSNRNVHHDRDDCYEGQKIEKKHKVENSTGGKPLCLVCKGLA